MSVLAPPDAPGQALRALAASLAAESTPLSPVTIEAPGDSPALGVLVAAGPRASSDPGAYALMIEAIREGYLLHHGDPRIARPADPDLALLGGDYLYSRGLELLARLGDLDAVAELAGLIALLSQVHARRSPAEQPACLWVAAAVAIAAGSSEEHRLGLDAIRRDSPDATSILWRGAAITAAREGLSDHLLAACETVGFEPSGAPELG